MSDTSNTGSTLNIEQLADEIIAERPRKVMNQYGGAPSRRRMLREKYKNCERVRVRGGMARKLTDAELAEWAEGIRRIFDPSYVTTRPKKRRAVV